MKASATGHHAKSKPCIINAKRYQSPQKPIKQREQKPVHFIPYICGKEMSLNNRHITVAGLMSLFVTIATITIFLHYLDLHAAEISTVSIVLLVVGLAAGSLIPSILTTWLIILLSVLGIAILLLGTVPISLSSKLMLLAVFPVGAGLTSINRYVLLRSGWGKSNRRDIERYAFHYNPVTKLQQTHNAEKMYQKTVRFIQNDPDATLWFNITAIHWANNT
jgi:hypothetical protein